MIVLEWLVATDDPEKVASLVAAFMEACREAGIGVPGSGMETEVSLVAFSSRGRIPATFPECADDELDR